MPISEQVAAKAAYTVNEVAEILSVHPLTIYRQVERGQLDAIRVGRAIRISASVVDSLLAGVAL